MKDSTFYRTIKVDELSIFYREAGPKDAPTLLLLHGLPSSSRMFEPLFTRLSDRYLRKRRAEVHEITQEPRADLGKAIREFSRVYDSEGWKMILKNSGWQLALGDAFQGKLVQAQGSSGDSG